MVKLFTLIDLRETASRAKYGTRLSGPHPANGCRFHKNFGGPLAKELWSIIFFSPAGHSERLLPKPSV